MSENPDYYYTIEEEGKAEFKDRGSLFIGYAFPINAVEQFRERLARVKKEHPKATHHCFAYRIGADGNTFRVSDDGEPSGSAGRPILNQIDSRSVIDAVIIVARYFGGTQLGIPGLISAYKTTASLTLQVIPIVQKPVLETFRIEFDYTQMNEVMRAVKQFDCIVSRQQVQLFCEMEIGVPKNWRDEFLYRLSQMRAVTIISLTERATKK